MNASVIILENNIYGVDLNDESVEIAKLSLWLRTAQKGRKLNSLNNNIKCGNSLIDDPSIAGDKAFSWEKEFPDVFEKGGFDVILGNPPYVQSTALDEPTKKAIYEKYVSAEYQINTYGIFIEQIFNLLNDKALYGLIVPNYWLSTKYDSVLRNIIFNKNHAIELINVYQVFEDANVDTLLLIGMKTKELLFPKRTSVKSVSNRLKTIESRLTALNLGIYEYNEITNILDADQISQISFQKGINLKGSKTIGDFLNGFQGMKPYELGKGVPKQTREMMESRIYQSNKKIDETYFPLVGAGNIQRYFIRDHKEYIKYGINLAAARKFEIFSKPRILVSRIFSRDKIDAVFSNETLINNTDVFNYLEKKDCTVNLFAVLALICSKLCAFHFKSTNVNLDRSAFPKLNVNHVLSFPLPDKFYEIQQELFATKTENLISLNKYFQSLSQKFSTYFASQYKIEKISGKLEKWYELEFTDFIKELNKATKTVGGLALTKKDEFEWMDLFNENKQKALYIKAEIVKADEEIDQMVYESYGLTEEEIKIVEGN